MKHILTITLVMIASNTTAQMTIDAARDSLVRKYHIGASTYLDQFVGHAGYGAVVITTSDGGAAAFGDGDEGLNLYKLDKTGKLQWKKKIARKGTEMEPQCVVQDSKGNFYLFSLVYGLTSYRGGCERIVYVSKAGTLGFDKQIGTCQMINSPTVSYTRTLQDGRVAIRGHVATEKPAEGKDPVYHYWEAWINSTGTLTQKVGDVLDWSDEKWKKLFAPEAQ
ncbi:MAG TPA: hypothetical protein VG737_02105 [Cyclobacteriaceae bacterium]|nr:hypothetical protein [Cyclobacteriaceae bacterium]